MKNIIIDLKNSIITTIILGIILCGLYPLAVWGVGQALFSHQANGSLIIDKDGKTILGSELLGQNFTSDKYFNSRPSAAGTGYDATSSGGTNLGPTSQKLNDSIKAAVDAYRKQNNLAADASVPADAVTSSGSGLDPHISVQNAVLQTPRVAKARNLSPDQVAALVQKYTDGRDFGILGEPRVNVLKLNLALDGKL
jgi:K+-transporting ATPase ATPase C chain